MALRGWGLPNAFNFVAICAVGILLCSCGSFTKSLELAKQNVEQFHSGALLRTVHAVYATCDEKFQEATSESDFSKLLEALTGSLGTFSRRTCVTLLLRGFQDREQQSLLSTRQNSLRELAPNSLSGTLRTAAQLCIATTSTRTN